MVGHDAVTTSGGGLNRISTRVIAGLGATALLAIAVAVLVAVLGAGSATARSGDPGPQPYGGALERSDPGDEVSPENVLEVAMLALGTVNGLAFAVAMVASRLRGPSTAQTRRALIARTEAGVVSESRRERRLRAQRRARRPVPSQPIAVVPGGPRYLAPRTPPPGAVPVQDGAAAREALVQAARAPQSARGPGGAHRRPGPMSPPVGVPTPVRPADRR